MKPETDDVKKDDILPDLQTNKKGQLPRENKRGGMSNQRGAFGHSLCKKKGETIDGDFCVGDCKHNSGCKTIKRHYKRAGFSR